MFYLKSLLLNFPSVYASLTTTLLNHLSEAVPASRRGHSPGVVAVIEACLEYVAFLTPEFGHTIRAFFTKHSLSPSFRVLSLSFLSSSSQVTLTLHHIHDLIPYFCSFSSRPEELQRIYVLVFHSRSSSRRKTACKATTSNSFSLELAAFAQNTTAEPDWPAILMIRAYALILFFCDADLTDEEVAHLTSLMSRSATWSSDACNALVATLLVLAVRLPFLFSLVLSSQATQRNAGDTSALQSCLTPSSPPNHARHALILLASSENTNDSSFVPLTTTGGSS